MFSKNKREKEIATGKKLKTGGVIADIKKDLPLYLMFLPFVLHLLIFTYKPMLGILIAFKDYNVYQGIAASEWVGLEHFKSFLSGAYFLRTCRNTFAIGILNLIFTFPAPILLAILLNEVRNRKLKSFFQTATFLPHFVSLVVICGITVNLLAPGGIINNLIEKFGGERIYFLLKPEWFRTIYISTGIWAGCGYSSIIYLAALSGIDTTLYEACEIDGGNKLRKILHITIPGILPTIVVKLMLQIGHVFSVGFEKIILLYQPVTYEKADVISSYMYRVGMTDGKYDLATAVGLFNSLIALVFVVSSNYIAKRLTDISLF